MKSKSSVKKTFRFSARLPWLWVILLPVITTWTSTLSSAQNCAPAPSGLVSWWRGENNASDQNSNNNGSLIGSTGYGTAKVGNGFVFDGDHDAVSVGNPANLQLQNFTIEAWVKRFNANIATLAPEAAPGVGPIFCYAWGGYGFYILDDGHLGMGKIGSSGVVSTLTMTDTNNFHHLAVTKLGGSIVFYIDGVANPVAGSYDPGFSFGGPAAIGARGGDWVSTLLGAVDEVSIYDRALTQIEIQELYNANNLGKCTSPTAPVVFVDPTNQTVNSGSPVLMSVLAGGTSPLSYQWRKGSVALAGANSATLSLFNVLTNAAGDYDVVITNVAGAVTSVVATLTVNQTIETGCASAPSGLVGWWRGENNTFDHNLTNNGSFIGNTTYGAGRVGNGFVFDGFGDAVSVGSDPSLQLQDFTIEGWIKRSSSSVATANPEGSPGSGVIFAGPWGSYGFVLWDSGQLVLTKIGFSGVISSRTVTDTSSFHHVVVTKSGGTVVFYVDGQSDPVGAYDPGFSFGGVMAIGARAGDWASSFLGSIDEISVYDRALSAIEIQTIYQASSVGKCTSPTAPSVLSQSTNQVVNEGNSVVFNVTAGGTAPLSYQWRKNSTEIPGATNPTLPLSNVTTNDTGDYDVVITNIVGSVTSIVATLTVNPVECVNPPSGLVSWWRGEGNAEDSISANHGSLQNGTTLASGKVGQAFSFDGVDDYVQVGNMPELVMSNAMTVEAWIYPTGEGNGPGGDGTIVSKEGEYVMARFTDGTIRWAIAAGPVWFWTATPLVAPLNAWTHVALVYSNGVVKIYGNGSLSQSTSGLGSLTDIYPTLNDFQIGGRQAVSVNFKGLIDEVSVYQSALAAGDIAAIYNAGSAGKCVLPIASFIKTQPGNVTVTAGDNATFSVSAGGSFPLSYQWLRDNTNVIADATNSSLTLNNVQVGQAGTYSVVVTNPVSSVTSSNALLTVNFPTAIVRVPVTNVASAATFSVPVQLVANGNENAVGFTLNFTTSQVSYAAITLGSGAAGASLILNSSQTGSGQLGVAVGLPSGGTFAAGTQEVVRVSFVSAVVTTPTPTTLSFGDALIARQLSDAPGNDLPVNFTSGTVNIAAAEYEGDVSPRPNGSKTVTITDWVLVGNYAALLDAPTNSSEFQRADCAPRSSLGNGAITVSDWVQAGRYLALLDPPTVAGGPTSGSGLVVSSLKSSGGGPANLTSRQVMASSTSLLQGDSTTVSVNLVSQGDENALQFSLGYSPTALNYTSAALGSSSSGATLNINTNQIGLGRIGFVLALPTGNHYVAGTQETVKVNFKSVASAAGSFAVNLIDLPLVREVSDPQAIALEANYVNGAVVLNPPPSLRIAQSGQNVTLAWPSWAANFGLQVSDGAAPLSANWTNLVATPSVINNENVVSQPLGGATKFYRLFRP